MMRFILALALGASAQTRISLTQAARQPTLTTDDVEQLLAVAQRPVTPQGLVIVERTEYQVEDPGGFVRSMLQDFFGPPPQQTMYQPRYYSDDGPSRHDFGCPCGEDVDSYCSKTDDDDAYASIFEKRLCLGDHFDQLSEQCAAHLASAPTVVEYCRAEILETCRNVQPGENRVHECLLARPTVGDACASYLATLAPPTPPKPPMLMGGLLDMVDAFFGGDAFVQQDDTMLYDEVLEVPPAPRRFDAGGFAPPPRFSRVEGPPPPRARGFGPPPQPRFDDVVDYVRMPGGSELAVNDVCYRFCEDGSKPMVDRRGDCPVGTACRTTLPPDVLAFDTCDAPDTCQPAQRPPPHTREVIVEVEAEEEDAALEEEEAAAAASLLVLASAAALCLASLSLAVLALGAARRRQREREELAAFKANYAPMLSENEQA